MPVVLHVISGLKVGGAEMFLHRLILNSRGGEFTHAVVALHTEGSMRQRFINAGIELIVFDFKRSPVLDFFRLNNPPNADMIAITEIMPPIIQNQYILILFQIFIFFSVCVFI